MKRKYFIQKNWFYTLFVLIIYTSCNVPLTENLELLPLFSDNMLLQQETEVPIWGTATPGSKVQVIFRNQKVKTKVDNSGKWMVKLHPLAVGLSDSMVIQNGELQKVFHNVAVGEVWIASGQSNMEMPMISNWAHVDNAEAETVVANYPNIRLFMVNRNTAVTPIDSLASGGWKSCTPESVKNFSATGYFFARELHNQLEIPIGVIETAWGGTVAEAWTSAETLSLLKNFAGTIEKMKNIPLDKEGQEAQYEIDLKTQQIEMAVADPGIEGNDTLFTKADWNDLDWMPMNLPVLWENTDFGVFDGVVWFRKKVSLPASLAGKAMILDVPPSDDFDEAWVNGVKVGQSGLWGEPRHYSVAKGVIKSGENVITLRVSDWQGAGGFNGKPEELALRTENWRKQINTGWVCLAGYNMLDIKTTPIKPGDPNNATVLFNAMINPLIPYAFKGVIWYQGESNTGKAFEYRELFSALIKDWRQKWNIGDFPFYCVQLASHMQRNTKPVDDMWAELREAQNLALQLPNTGVAVAIDLGHATNIHPGNKQDVGKRLAYWALNKTYQVNIPCSGPLYKSMEITGNKINIQFDYMYEGLKTSDGKSLTGFAIAGDDKKFVWANAEISGDQIVVTSSEVPNPVAVRYAWSANPECNLINSANLPASPFRTDNWKLVTE